MLKDFAYHALADLVYRGALFLSVEYAGYFIVFKTINDKEYALIRLRAGSSDRIDYSTQFNAVYLAYSVFMVDGENVLKDGRDVKITKLIEFFKTIPAVLYNKILSEMIELRSSLTELGNYLEGFCYTQQSRHVWNLLGNGRINDDDFSGIQGMKAVGLNSYQENWISVNKLLDEEEDYSHSFSLALLIASASNAKGSSKIRAQHDASTQASKDKRKVIAKEGFSRKDAWKEHGWAAPVDTAEELVAELERQMEGKKDRHDKLVDDYLKSLQDETDKVASEEKRKMDESVERHKDEPVITGSQRALTPEETEKMLSSRSSNNLVIVESEDAPTADEKEVFYKKIGTKILTPKK